MTRKPNKKTERAPLAIAFRFHREEFDTLKWNQKPENSDLGGYARMENYLIDNTDEMTGWCVCDPDHFVRLINYMKSHGPGGPNERMRRACPPALARIGIPVTLDWGEDGKPDHNDEEN